MATPAKTPQLLDVNEAADYLHVSVRMVRRLINERRIPFHKLGRHVRLRSADLDAFIEAGRVEPPRVARGGLRRCR